jgi:uncharacterized protein YfaS (alpha-2-macroglobulin family)
MRVWLGRLALLALALAPASATGDTNPQVVSATPGLGGGAIERFTIRFSEAMVPLGDPRAKAPIAVTCPVGGTGRWIDPQTFVHEFARSLPGGLTCNAALVPGLASLRGAEVAGERRFAIDTGGPSARAVLPARYGDEIEEDQVFLVAANALADRASIAREAYCAVDGIGEKIAVDLLPAEAPGRVLAGMGTNRYEVSNFLSEGGLPKELDKDPAARTRALATVVALKCRRPLPPGRDMALVWSAAIKGADGRAAGEDQRFDYSVRKAFEARFECSRVNPQAGCNPVLPAYVRFTAPIPVEQARAIRLDLGDGKPRLPVIGGSGGGDEEGGDTRTPSTVSEVSFKAPLPEAATGRIVLPANVRDESGRALVNAARFPLEVRFDEAPPLVKFAADFGIVEAADPVLPVTVRNVEATLAGQRLTIGGGVARIEGDDATIAKWLRDIQKAGESEYRDEKRGGKTVPVNYTGSASILNGRAAARPLNVALPGKGKAFEVVGLPLGKPGFYVVELASPRLGAALLGRKAPRYVAAGALVTNLSVHFKWGRAASLAWVTALDSGKPVAGAEVRVTDACSGRELAAGRSDGQGRLIVPGGLPEPETYGACENDGPHPLMVSARIAGDFGFTMTAWGQGIRPFDFDLPYGWSKPEDIVHTIFDRTLLRAGETVHMKHVVRRPAAAGFVLAGAMSGTLRLTHRGSDTQFELPLAIGADGIGENEWTAPQGAPQGDYDLAMVVGDKTIFTEQSVRVDEYRLPTMRATVSGPKTPAIRAKTLPIDLYVGYLAGGGASNMGVALRAAFEEDSASPKGWDGWTFGGRPVVEGVRPLDGDGQESRTPLPNAQNLPVTLDGAGTARTTIDIPATLDGPTVMAVEMDYQDANGETLTASRRIPLLPSAVRVGIKTDGWLMKQDDLRLKLVVLDPEGRPVAGRKVRVDLYSREILSARRRLIGGFYAFDNNARTTKLKESCTATTDKLGLASCALDPGLSGEVYAVATAEDDDGNVSRAVRSVWLVGDEDWWFGGDNGDRMDLIPEALDYKSGDTARFQVRMPFRSATALVTVEREGVLSSFVTTLSGKDPVVEVPLAGTYAPDVYVSVLAVRGRIAGWRLWLADFARRWNLPFFSREGARPTALVDLAKPSFRIGMAKINVGWEAHALAVDVTADKPKYRVRDTAQVSVRVRGADGKPPASAEIAFAAVDEALLQLAPNQSWKLIDAMMGERPLSVLTSTAQTQVVGKRHYGRKAVAAGGGGGDLSAVNRENFRPVLLWRGRVPLDAAGRARLSVPLSDSLSAFRLVAIATAGPGRFGTGDTTVRTTQDLTLYSGLPPLVRSGDFFGASFTLRNGSDKPMQVTATAETFPRVGTAAPLTVTIPAGGAAPVTWHLPAPEGLAKLSWTVSARAADGRAADKLTVSQAIVPAVPLETWAATLTRVAEQSTLAIAAPAGALPGRGEVQVRLVSSLSPPLDGVRRYMSDYPFNCFEQRLSRAVATDDVGAWNRLAGEIPAYIDGDGLLRYFPIESLEGSEALTAYVLSITAEAGYAVPEAAKARMIEALRGVVAGRLTREGGANGDQRLQRLAALAALARNGAADTAMLDQIGIAAKDMPTSALADWIVALDRTPGADPALRTAAEQTLRQRLVYEGSRLDLIDAGAAPWWMMTSGDEMAIRALLIAIGRPGWEAEAPRMMVGAALRQRGGHWDTTPANAWGTVAARRFASRYPPTAVAGTTTLRLGAATRTAGWPQSDGALLRLPLPPAPSPLLMTQAGGAGPWAQVAVTAAVPLRQPFSAGYRLSRQVQVVQQRNPGRLTRGDVLRVRLTVEATAERNWVVVEDPIPAGATVIGGLANQSAQLSAGSGAEEGTQPSYVERGQDAWRGYFAWLPRGRHVVEYAVRLNGAGTLQLPPSRVAAMYSPEIRAAVPNRPVVVGMR